MKATLRIVPVILTICFLCQILQGSLRNEPGTQKVIAASDVKTYKVVLSKSSESTNRTVYIQARDSSQARQIAKDQNPGWQVELVTEEK